MQVQRIVHKGHDKDPYHKRFPEIHVFVYVHGCSDRRCFCSILFDTALRSEKETPKVIIPSYGAVTVAELDLYLEAIKKTVEIANRGWDWAMSLPEGESWVEE